MEWGTINHNAAVSACVKAKGLRDMEQDTIMYSAAISACAKGSDWSRVVDHLILRAGDHVEQYTVKTLAPYSVVS